MSSNRTASPIDSDSTLITPPENPNTVFPAANPAMTPETPSSTTAHRPGRRGRDDACGSGRGSARHGQRPYYRQPGLSPCRIGQAVLIICYKAARLAGKGKTMRAESIWSLENSTVGSSPGPAISGSSAPAPPLPFSISSRSEHKN